MPQQPRDQLLVSERPVRSDYSRDKSYAHRRLATLAVIALVLGGIGYGLWGHRPVNPADIPTIQALTSYREKPADPGGIDIPHQDVQVYSELEGKNTPQPLVEHLLPLPEVPQDVPHTPPTAPTAPASGNAMESHAIGSQSDLPPIPDAAPLIAVTPHSEALAPQVTAKTDIMLNEAAPPPIATTVGLEAAKPAIPDSPPAPVATEPPQPAVVTHAAQKQAATGAPVSLAPQARAPSVPMTIEQVIKQTQPDAPRMAPVAAQVSTQPKQAAVPAPADMAGGSYAVQLASSPDQAKAQGMMIDLQRKYSAQLAGAQLRLATADLGSRGVFYRIQSQGLSEDRANRICSALQQIRAGCILVRK
jgi:hypothetical protein